MTDTSTIDPAIANLRSEVDDLRRQLVELRQQLSEEVRTRRVVVVDEQGRERVYTTVGEYYSQIHVAFSENPNPDADLGRGCVTLYAGAESGEEGCPNALLDVVIDGNAVASLGGLVEPKRFSPERTATGELDICTTVGPIGVDNTRGRVRVRPTEIRRGYGRDLAGRVRWEYAPEQEG